MPVRPVEVMLGKIVPYVGLAYVQTALILVVSVIVFQVPVRGSIPLLLVALGVFIACNLAMGFAFSTMATTQMQAQQLSQFGLLPSIMLSGWSLESLRMACRSTPAKRSQSKVSCAAGDCLRGMRPSRG